jgi:hypothetical protein
VWCTPRGDARAAAPRAWWWSFLASGREGGGVGSHGRRGSGPQDRGASCSDDELLGGLASATWVDRLQRSWV